MIRLLKPFLAPASCLLILGATASAQFAPTPEITFDSPTSGQDLEDVTDEEFFYKGRATVSGTAGIDANAEDGTRITAVQYRLEGNRRWRKAVLVGDSTAGYNWSFRVSVKRKAARRVYVRSIDSAKNESDIIGRRIFRRRGTPTPAPAPLPSASASANSVGAALQQAARFVGGQ